jgi:four helix bundle protein
MKAKKFEDLIVWQKAHQLVLAIYKLTRDFPREELFGLTSQIRRAAVSVPANARPVK